MRINRMPGALVIITGLLIMTAAFCIAIFNPDMDWGDWCWMGLMAFVGLGATLGGSEMLKP